MDYSRFGRIRTQKLPKLIKTKVGVDDYVGDITPCAKILNDHPFGSILAYG